MAPASEFMKILLPTVILFSVVLFVEAQNYSRVYGGNSIQWGGEPTSLVTKGDTLVVISFTQNNFRQIIFRSFTRSGTLLDSNVVEGDTSIFAIAIRKNSIEQSGNNYYSLHDHFHNDGSSEVHIFQLNSGLDTIKTVIFNPMNANAVNSYDLIADSTTITVLGHYALPNYKLSLFIARYDKDLNLQWYTTIADFRPHIQGFYKGNDRFRIRSTSNNYYIAGRCFYPYRFVEGFLVKTDLFGNKIWEERYRYKGYNCVNADVVPIGRDSLFIPHFYLSSQVGAPDSAKVIFRIIDSTGIELKDSLYPEEEASYSLEQAEFFDESIYVTGHFYQGGSKALIWKLDKSLNTIWRRVYYYGDWEDESFLYNINQWSDGGLIGVGTYYDRYLNPNWEALYLWLLSTDSIGCLGLGNCGSDLHAVEWALPGEGIKMYPNPAIHYINIELGLSGLRNSMATATLYNLNGQMVMQREIKFNSGRSHFPLQDRSGRRLIPGDYLVHLKTDTHLFVEKLRIN